MSYEVKFQHEGAEYKVIGPDIDGMLRLIQGLQGVGRVPEPNDTPWYPDNSGEWVEVSEDCRTCPVPGNPVIRILETAEREGEYSAGYSLRANDCRWALLPNTSARIVAYKVVKP